MAGSNILDSRKRFLDGRPLPLNLALLASLVAALRGFRLAEKLDSDVLQNTLRAS